MLETLAVGSKNSPVSKFNRGKEMVLRNMCQGSKVTRNESTVEQLCWVAFTDSIIGEGEKVLSPHQP